PRRTLSRTDDATGADTSARADGDAQAAAGEQR
ncbi:universal stress protein, partial [Burkholderia multivorans]